MPFVRIINQTDAPIIIKDTKTRFVTTIAPSPGKYEDVVPQCVFDAIQPQLRRLKALNAVWWDATFYGGDRPADNIYSGKRDSSVSTTAPLVLPEVLVTIGSPALAGRHHRCDPSGGSFVLTFPRGLATPGGQLSVKHIAYTSDQIVTLVPIVGDTLDGDDSIELHAKEGGLWIATSAGWEQV